MQISGSTILLTGAAGGLGQATARVLSAAGARLILSGRNADQLNAIATELGATVLVADLTKEQGLSAAVDALGEVDILIANAGIGGDVPVPDETNDHINSVLDLNLRAPMVLATTLAQRHLANGTAAHIVLVGSLSGLAPSPVTRLYNATKFGLRGFGLALRQDLDGTSVGLSLVEPGFIRDAGMFAASGTVLPKGVRTKNPHDVAVAVKRSIEQNLGEVFVAPTELRLAATFATVAPGLSARLMKAAGAADIASGQNR